MRLNEIAEKLSLRNITPEIAGIARAEVVCGHASDLLSDVLANAPAGSLLITRHVHMNVLAVAVHAGVVGIIFASSRMPDELVVRKATEERVWLYVSKDSAFNIVGRLYALGLRGRYG